ncbi:hypothetical protein F5884DRAFT_811159 [Xylogone sp. PMI_703]|nr:hypothetical protein F5884DRAFT_811159 [Xylogone sp. PMI_703]
MRGTSPLHICKSAELHMDNSEQFNLLFPFSLPFLSCSFNPIAACSAPRRLSRSFPATSPAEITVQSAQARETKPEKPTCPPTSSGAVFQPPISRPTHPTSLRSACMLTSACLDLFAVVQLSPSRGLSLTEVVLSSPSTASVSNTGPLSCSLLSAVVHCAIRVGDARRRAINFKQAALFSSNLPHEPLFLCRVTAPECLCQWAIDRWSMEICLLPLALSSVFASG